MEFVAGGFIVLAFFIWSIICNERTRTQRLELINLRPMGEARYQDFAREWDAVSYDKHYWYLITFRDPKKLYGPLTQSVWP